MKRNAFGQLIPTNPYLRFFAPPEEPGGAGGDEFKAPASQEEFDRIINDRLARDRKKFDGHDDFKAKAAKWDAHEQAEAEKNKPKPKDGEAPAGVTETDVDKRINDALAAERRELAMERVTDRLEKALEGRSYSPAKLFSLDRGQFVAEDGKSVDEKALNDWVKENSTEVEKTDPKRKPIPGQGERGETTPGIDSGKAAYEKRHPKKN